MRLAADPRDSRSLDARTTVRICSLSEDRLATFVATALPQFRDYLPLIHQRFILWIGGAFLMTYGFANEYTESSIQGLLIAYYGAGIVFNERVEFPRNARSLSLIHEPGPPAAWIRRADRRSGPSQIDASIGSCPTGSVVPLRAIPGELSQGKRMECCTVASGHETRRGVRACPRTPDAFALRPAIFAPV